jgi:hypothetical protein
MIERKPYIPFMLPVRIACKDGMVFALVVGTSGNGEIILELMGSGSTIMVPIENFRAGCI